MKIYLIITAFKVNFLISEEFIPDKSSFNIDNENETVRLMKEISPLNINFVFIYIIYKRKK